MMQIDGKWILVNALFETEDNSQLEQLGIYTNKAFHELHSYPFRFNIYNIISYYKYDEENTCISFDGITDVRINVPFDEFDKLIIKLNK